MTLLTDGKTPPTLILGKVSAGRPSVSSLVEADAPILMAAGDVDGIHCPCCCPRAKVEVVCENPDVGRNSVQLAEIKDVLFNDVAVASPQSADFPSLPVPPEQCVQEAASFADSAGPCAQLEARDRDRVRLVAKRWYFPPNAWGTHWCDVTAGAGVWTSYSAMSHNIHLLDSMPDWRGFSDQSEREKWVKYYFGAYGSAHRSRAVIDLGTYHTETVWERRRRADGTWERYQTQVIVYDSHDYRMRFYYEPPEDFSTIFEEVCALVSDSFKDRFSLASGGDVGSVPEKTVGPVTTELKTGAWMVRPDANDVDHESFAPGHIGFQSLSFRILVPAGSATLRVSVAAGSALVTVNGVEYAVANGHDAYLNGLALSAEAPTAWNVSIWIPPSTVFLD